MDVRIPRLLAAALAFWLSGVALADPAADRPRPLLSTGVTGTVRGSGLEDPQYLLSFVPVQRLMLAASREPLTEADVARGLNGTPVGLADLLRLGLLRAERGRYRLNYLLLTVADQRAIFRVATRYGASLASAFEAHRAEFDAIGSQYPDAALRPELLFALVAGAALNWGGLDLTTELGLRAPPQRHADGGVYLVHSAEVGAGLDLTGLYLDSETAPGSTMSFSTFGDGASLPRLRGLPDVFDGIDSALDSWRAVPDVYAALRAEYISLMLLAIDDAGRLMRAVADGADTDAALANALALPEARRAGALGLLLATGYLRRDGSGYRPGVVVLTERERPLAAAALRLSRDIMTEWLERNYPSMAQALGGLSPRRNGLPFALVFSEVWHYELGIATRRLAEVGVYANPRARDSRYPGYVPVVWDNAVLTGPAR
jgi:hypothetical protein